LLKITVIDSADEQRWMLQGRLAGQWVDALTSAWEKDHDQQDKRRCLLDLNDVTFIDRKGEAVLDQLMNQGAEFIANGVYTKELLSGLRSAKERSEKERKLR
jgi:ABC-type transporter Mla MlaB component